MGEKSTRPLDFLDLVLNKFKEEKMKYGIIDIGSNTIRLIIYLVDEDKNITRLNDKKYVAGLASYIKKRFSNQKRRGQAGWRFK